MKIKKWNQRSWFTGWVICPLLLFALVFAAVVAAPALDGAAEAIDFDKSCSLTVNAAGGELAEDAAKANVVIDLYKVADAKPVSGYDTYTYEFLGDYAGLSLAADPDEAGWKALAQKAAQIALDGQKPQVEGVPAGEAIQDLGCGLYLIIARGKDLADYTMTITGEDGKESIATIAQSGEYTYEFSPSLVSLPGKEADEDGSVNTAGPGDWLYDFTVTMKPTQAIRFGSLEIVKTLSSYETKDPATFVFDVVARLGDQVVYSNVVSLSFTEAGQKSTLIEKLPVGATVTVTEVYSGAVYRPTSEVTRDTVIAADEVVSVTFTNTYDEDNRGGGSVTNHFEYNSDSGWGWTKITDRE